MSCLLVLYCFCGTKVGIIFGLAKLFPNIRLHYARASLLFRSELLHENIGLFLKSLAIDVPAGDFLKKVDAHNRQQIPGVLVK